MESSEVITQIDSGLRPFEMHVLSALQSLIIVSITDDFDLRRTRLPALRPHFGALLEISLGLPLSKKQTILIGWPTDRLAFSSFT